MKRKMNRLAIIVFVHVLIIKASLCLMQNNANSTYRTVEDENGSALVQDNSNSTEEDQDTTNVLQFGEKDSLKLERVARENRHSFCANCLKPKTYIFGSILLLVGCVPFAALFIAKRYYAKRNDDVPYGHFETESGTVCHI